MATRWIVGITGGIAAYKMPAFLRLLKKQDAEVRVVLSQGAQAFVTPMTLQAVSGSPVYSHLLDEDFEARMGHIELARWAQAILIAPLSANRLAALALGMADDLLTTLCLATRAPIWLAPAMNTYMWEHPATQAHVKTLQERGVTFLGPASGEQACGEIGMGRLLEPEEIIAQLFPHSQPLKELEVLITAGPTRESIDPVRFISNRSSGKMGFALAQASRALGARVTLITGPVSLPTPPGIERIEVQSAQEMYDTVMMRYACADIFISAAAVGDFRVETLEKQKIKKQNLSQTWQLSLVPNPDILASVSLSEKRPFCVGIAAETQDWEQEARKKLEEKKLDLIAVNDVSDPEIGFDANDNAFTILSQTQGYHIPKNTKYQAALALLKIVSECYNAKDKIKNP